MPINQQAPIHTRLQEALKTAQTMKFGPSISTSWAVANLYEEMGDKVNAEVWLRKALVSRCASPYEQKQTIHEVRMHLAKLLARRGKFSEALAYLNEIKNHQLSFGIVEYAFGEVYLSEDKESKALEHFINAYNQSGWRAAICIIKIYLSNDEIERARPYIEKLAKLKVIYGMYELAILNLKEGNIADAKSQFIEISQKKNISKDGGHLDYETVEKTWSNALYELATILIGEGNYLEAVKHLEQVVSTTQQIKSKYKLVECYRHTNVTKVLPLLQELVEQHKHIEAMLDLAIHWSTNGDEERAYLLYINESLKNNLTAQIFLGNYYFKKSEYKKAKQYLQSAYDKADKNSMLLMIKIWQNENNFGQAKICFEEYARKFFDPLDFYNFALTCMTANDTVTAEKYFKIVIETADFNVDKKFDTANNLAAIAKKNGDVNAQEQYFLKSLTFKHDMNIKLELGLLYVSEKQYVNAIRTLKEILIVSDENIVKYNLGLMLLALNNESEAIKFLTLCANDNYMDSQYLVGRSYLKRGNLLVAERWLSKAVATNTPETIEAATYVYIKLKKLVEAHDCIKKHPYKYSPNAYTYINFIVQLLCNNEKEALQMLRNVPSGKALQKYISEHHLIQEIELHLSNAESLSHATIIELFIWGFNNNLKNIINICIERALNLCGRSIFELSLYIQTYKFDQNKMWQILKLHEKLNVPLYIDHKSFVKNLTIRDIKLSTLFNFYRQDFEVCENKATLRLLLRSGFPIDENHHNSFVPKEAITLTKKIKSKRYTLSVVRELLNTGLCHVSQFDAETYNSMLHWAISLQDNDLLELFLQQEDVNLKIINLLGHTVFDVAMLTKNTKAIYLLREYMSRKQMTFCSTLVSSQTMKFAIMYSYQEVAIDVIPLYKKVWNEIFDLAISAHQNDVLIKLVDQYQFKVQIKHLSHALKCGNFHFLDVFFDKSDFSNNTIDELISFAITAKKPDLVKRLVISGHNVNINGDMQMNPLFHAARFDCSESIAYLVTVDGININKPVTNNEFTNVTPLWVAAAEGYEDVVKILLQQPGILTNIAGSSNSASAAETPEQIAKRYGHITIEHMIRLVQQSTDFLDTESVEAFDDQTVDDEMTSAAGSTTQRDELVQQLIRENQQLREQIAALQLQGEEDIADTIDMQWGYELHRRESVNTLETLRTNTSDSTSQSRRGTANANPNP